MRAIDLINYLIPPLKPSDTIQKASQWLEELRVYEIPVIQDQRFMGFVTDETLYSSDRSLESIDELQLEGHGCIGYGFQHFLEILKTAYAENSKSVAILDEKDAYLGVVTLEDLMEAYAKTSSIDSEGAILVISTNVRDYKLSEICRLVEAADVKVLGSHIANDLDDPSKLSLTLKINKEQTSYVISNLESNGYTVLESFSQAVNTMHEQERLDQLMNFLKF